MWVFHLVKHISKESKCINNINMYVDSVQDQTKSDKIRTICIPRGLERKRGTNRNVGELIRLL